MIEQSFWTLIPASRDAAILSLAVLALVGLLRNWLPPVWRHALLLLVAVRLIMPVLPDGPLSWHRLLPDSSLETNHASQSNTSNDAAKTAPFAPPEEAPVRELERGDEVLNHNEEDPIPLSGANIFEVSLRWLPVIWMGGCVAWFATYLYSWSAFRRRVRRLRVSAPAQEKRLREKLTALCASAGIRRCPSLRVSRAVPSPALAGVIRPEILMPSATLESLSDAELEHVLLHELGHLRRGDLLIGGIMTLLQAIHWFNPFVWLAFRQARREAERATDMWALKRMKESPAEYGETLIKLLQNSNEAPRVYGLVSVVENSRDLRRRVSEIARFRRKPRRLAIAGGLLLLVLVASIGLTQSPSDTSEETPVEVEISVVTKDGIPVAGAEVYLSSLNSTMLQKKHPIMLAGKTNANGKMKGQTKPFPNSYQFLQMAVMVVSKESGCAYSWLQVRKPISDPVQRQIITLEPSAELTVKILDPEGNPAPGLKLRVDGLSKELVREGQEETFPLWIYPPELPGELWQAETDKDGVAVLGQLPFGSRVHLTHDRSNWATFPGHHNILITNLMVGGEPQTLRAQPASSLQGRISLPDGSPARGVEVQLRNFMPYTTAHGDATITDEKGFYRFDRIPAGGYNLYVHVEGDLYGKWVSPEEERGVRIEEGRSVEGVDFVLVEGFTVTGRKINGVSGEEVAPPVTWVLPEGTHKIYYSGAIPKGYHTSREEFEVTVGPNAGLEVDLMFIPQGEADAFFGVVVNDEGQPVPGAEVICSLDGPPYQKKTITDEKGRFEVTLWPGQQYSRLFAAKDEQATPEKVRCVAGKESRIVITSSDLPRVRGRVVDETGNPIQGARISWNTERIPGMPKELFTNAEGQYVIERMTASSHAGIFASASGYGEGMDQVELKPGDDLTLDDLVLLTAQSKVAGQVVDSEGNPVAHVKVSVEGYLQPSRGVVGESDSHGRFELSGLVDRWFWITALVQTSDSTSRRYKTRAKAGMTEVLLTIPNEATELSYPELIDHIGKPAPPLKADYWINSLPLPEESSGKVRMVEFVAMDRSLLFFSRVLPSLQKFRNAHPTDELEVIIIHGPWPPQEAEELLEEKYPNLNLPIAFESRESRMSEALGVSSWQTLVIDQDNVVRFQSTSEWAQAKKVALELLNKEE